jgi:hypothetical protein
MGIPARMIRRWPALVVAATAVATPMLLTVCRDDKNPSTPTISLVEPTIDPDLSVVSLPPVSG